MYCNAIAVLKIDSVYKQSKNYHMQVYVEECKYADAESQQCSMLSNSEWQIFCGVKGDKNRKKDYCNLVEGYKVINKHIVEVVKSSKSVKYTSPRNV